MKTVGRFRNLGETHTKVLMLLAEDPDIQKLLLNDGKNPLEVEPPQERVDELIGTRIVFNPSMPENDNQMSNYIVASIDRISSTRGNSDFKDIQLRFDVICNFEQWSINEKAPRPYLIMNRIDELFNGVEVSSIGSLQYNDTVRLVISAELGGYSMTYDTRDFN